MITTWKSAKKGDIAITDLVTPHLTNCVKKVETELTATSLTEAERTTKTELLTALRSELETRTDVA